MKSPIEDIFQKTNEYKLKTKFGFDNFDAIRKQKKECIKLYFDKHHKPIIVSKDHVFIVLDYELVARYFKNRRCFRNFIGSN